MSATDRLLANYSRQVCLPWAANVAGMQRVWFAVYPPAEERRVRARLPQFEAVTLGANHGWSVVDLNDLLPSWIAAHEYREAIFAEPEYLSVSRELEDLAVERVWQSCAGGDVSDATVIAVVGLSTLFDFMRVSSLVNRVEDGVRGRLLVLFPGEYAGNVYRFMYARDGFNYMAVPITSIGSYLDP